MTFRRAIRSVGLAYVLLFIIFVSPLTRAFFVVVMALSMGSDIRTMFCGSYSDRIGPAYWAT